jgi:medium-chain acyl-[acyl-carrier-protein] hydrolase
MTTLSVRSAVRSPWFREEPGRGPGRLRLFCLPHAGAGSLAFMGWDRVLSEDVEVVPVRPPGREERFWDPPYTRADSYVRDLGGALVWNLDGPYALFGHSVGALLAYELTRFLVAAGAPAPAHLFVSGRIAPHLADPRPVLHRMPDSTLLRELSALGGLPEVAAATPELLDYLLPVLRADLAVNETYRHAEGPRLSVPITALGGAQDPKVTPAELAAWRELTDGPFEQHLFDGGHFFVATQRDRLLATLGRTLEPLIHQA